MGAQDGLPTFEAYLQPGGAVQRRLLALMADGHGRERHGSELGHPSRATYQRRVARHLREAPFAFEVTGDDDKPRYFVADPARNQAAWITPHKQDRSTFFQPRNGVADYVRHQHETKPAERWIALDIEATRERGRESQRTAAHAITSVRRVPRGRQLEP
jgi:hypothetical protein